MEVAAYCLPSHRIKNEFYPLNVRTIGRERDSLKLGEILLLLFENKSSCAHASTYLHFSLNATTRARASSNVAVKVINAFSILFFLCRQGRAHRRTSHYFIMEIARVFCVPMNLRNYDDFIVSGRELNKLDGFV